MRVQPSGRYLHLKYLSKASALEAWNISAEARRGKLACLPSIDVEMRAQVTHEGDENDNIINKRKALNISVDRSGAAVILGSFRLEETS